MEKRILTAFFVGLLLVAVTLLVWRMMRPVAPTVGGSLPKVCRDADFETVAYVICEMDPGAYDVRLFLGDAAGKPFGSVAAFDRAMTAQGTPSLLTMNAGMYHKDLSPVGLFVEAGRQLAPLNVMDGAGNFFMKPNGVFLIGKDGKAAVLETSAYAVRKPDVAYATQSGPMLVIGGLIHPRFEVDGASRYVRNGVGVRDDGTVVLAISRTPVSLGSFARLFRDGLQCPDALFLDGAISTLSNGRRTIVGGKYPAGPLLAVTAKE